MTVARSPASAVAFLFAFLAGAAAQLPTARLHTISPCGGQIGATFEVSLSGADLDDVAELRFSDTNVSAAPKIVAETGLPDPARFVVTIASNAVPGWCEARAAGRFGLSNPRAFALGTLPELAEKSANHSPETAMEVSVNSTINAHTDANAVDHFRLPVSKGRRILIDCRARSLDSRMEPVVILCDAAGRELERARRREVIDFTPLVDGTNILKVYDALYQGGPEFFYRLSISTAPHIDVVLPAAAQPATTNRHVLYGRNLPGGSLVTNITLRGKPLEQLEVQIVAPTLAEGRTPLDPQALAVSGFYYRLPGPSTAAMSEPIFIPFASAPVVLEQGGNDRPDSSQKVAPPCEVSGQLFPAGDIDWVAFDAKKGDVYWLEIFSHRLGLPTDPFFVVQRVTKNDKGETTATDLHEGYDLDANVGGQEFKTTTFDPAWRFEASEDGAYRVQVRDLFNRTANDPRYSYRLSIRKEAPDFHLVALPQLPGTKKEREAMPWTAVLRRGETSPLRVLALRRDGFAGEIALSVEGLPGDVSVAPAKIESGKNSAQILFTASGTASNWHGAIKIIGKAKASASNKPEMVLTREAIGGTTLWRVEDWNNEAVRSRITPQLALAIAPEPTPVVVAVAATNNLEAVAGAKLQIPLNVSRNGDFNEKLKLKIAGAPQLDSVKEFEVDGKATNASFELDLAQAKLPAGTHLVYFQTQTKGKYSANAEGASQAEAAAREADAAFTNATALAKNAADALAAAAKALAESETVAKTAADKLAAARAASAQNTGDQGLTATLAEAERAAAEADAKVKAASEAKNFAEKKAAELAAAAKNAEVRKNALAALAKDKTERAKPKEVTVSLYSKPFEIKVNPAPAATAKK